MHGEAKVAELIRTFENPQEVDSVSAGDRETHLSSLLDILQGSSALAAETVPEAPTEKSNKSKKKPRKSDDKDFLPPSAKKKSSKISKTPPKCLKHKFSDPRPLQNSDDDSDSENEDKFLRICSVCNFEEIYC